MYKILGVQTSKGSYNGFDYDNIKFHCAKNSDSDYILGQEVEIITVSKKFYDNNINFELSDLVGKSCKVFYNKKGKVDIFEVIDKK